MASGGAVTAVWTFGGRWDPEAELPALLPAEYLQKRLSGSGTSSP
jgi:hypothetical protein